MTDDFFAGEGFDAEDEDDFGVVHREPEWHGPPQGSLPGVVPLELVLARTETVAVCVSGINAYPTGFEFELRTLGAPEAPEVDPHLFEPSGHGRRRPGEIPPELLRFGIQFPDGSKVTNLGPHGFIFGGAEPEGPVLIERGGGGGGLEWRQSMWVWPLPDAGEMIFVCEWPAAGIGVTRRPVETAPIRQAATRAQTVFSWDHVPLWDEEDDD
jgi:hypothetical protein